MISLSACSRYLSLGRYPWRLNHIPQALQSVLAPRGPLRRAGVRRPEQWHQRHFHEERSVDGADVGEGGDVSIWFICSLRREGSTGVLGALRCLVGFWGLIVVGADWERSAGDEGFGWLV